MVQPYGSFAPWLLIIRPRLPRQNPVSQKA
jgi:hypothetical protein